MRSCRCGRRTLTIRSWDGEAIQLRSSRQNVELQAQLRLLKEQAKTHNDQIFEEKTKAVNKTTELKKEMEKEIISLLALLDKTLSFLHFIGLCKLMKKL